MYKYNRLLDHTFQPSSHNAKPATFVIIVVCVVFGTCILPESVVRLSVQVESIKSEGEREGKREGQLANFPLSTSATLKVNDNMLADWEGFCMGAV